MSVQVAVRPEVAEADERICAGIRMTNDAIKLMFDLEGWRDFGFGSWAEYAADRGVELRIPPDERRERARELYQHGMTIRQIGEALGTSRGTAANDVRKLGRPNPPVQDWTTEEGSPKYDREVQVRPPTCQPKVIRQHIVDQLQAWENDTLRLANCGLTDDELMLMRRSLHRISEAIRER